MPTNNYYNHGSIPQNGTPGDAQEVGAEFDSVQAGFAKMAPLSGNGGKLVVVNAGGSAQEAVAADGVISATINTATSKATPVDADEIGYWDSVSTSLRKIPWLNIKTTLKTYFDGLYVALSGNQTIAGVKTFLEPIGVAPAVASADATQLRDISLFPTVASAASPDIFGAAGRLINYTGTITATGFAACTDAQVGSTKRLKLAAAASFTAAAGLTIDGASSGGTVTYSAGAVLDVTALTNNTFALETVYDSGVWTPTGIGQTFTSASGHYVRIRDLCFIDGKATWSSNGAGNQAGLVGFPHPCSFAIDGGEGGITIGYQNYAADLILRYPGYAASPNGLLVYTPVGGAAVSDSAMSTATLYFSGCYRCAV